MNIYVQTIKSIYRATVRNPWTFFRNYITTKVVRLKVRKSIYPIKIVVGAGGTKFLGWISTEITDLNILSIKSWAELLNEKSVTNLLAEHVFEHLTYNEAKKALRNAYKYLDRGGIIRIAVPDKNHPSTYVKELTKPGGSDKGSDDHKSFWDVNSLRQLAEDIGFKVYTIEYFDKNGKFHFKKMKIDAGHVSRSKNNYTGRFTNSLSEYVKLLKTTPKKLRNQMIDKNITYTSLIIDCRK